MRFQVSCKPRSFGRTRYRKATVETTNRPEINRRRRVKRTRGISSRACSPGATAVTPELLPVLDHHSPHVHRLPILKISVQGGPPRGGRGDRPVEHGSEVEHGVHPGRGGPKLAAVAQPDVADRAVRDEEPHP